MTHQSDPIILFPFELKLPSGVIFFIQKNNIIIFFHDKSKERDRTSEKKKTLVSKESLYTQKLPITPNQEKKKPKKKYLTTQWRKILPKKLSKKSRLLALIPSQIGINASLNGGSLLFKQRSINRTTC